MKNLAGWKRASQRTDPELPRPELLSGERGRNWTVKDSDDGKTSMVDPQDKRMEAPGNRGTCDLCGQTHAASVRYHELLHAQHSPEGEIRQSYTYKGEPRYVENEYIHLSEETRIDTIARDSWPHTMIPGDEARYTPVCEISFRMAELKLLRQRKWRDLAELTFTGATLRMSPLMLDGGALIGEYSERLWKTTSPTQKNRISKASLTNWVERFYEDVSEGWGHHILTEFTKADPNHTAMLLPILADMYMSLRYRADWHMLVQNPYEDFKRSGMEIENASWTTVLKVGKELQERFRAWEDRFRELRKEIQQMAEEAMAATKKGDEDAANVITYNAMASALKDPAMSTMRRAQNKARSKQGIGPRVEEYIKQQGGKLMPVTTREAKKRRGYPARAQVYHVPEDGSKAIEWGTYELVTPPLTKKFPEHKLQKSRSSARPEGDVPRHMHRYASDMQIFDSKRKIYGASLLIDDSGSMGFTHKQLEEILDLAPASTIATYSGSGYDGHLKIIAHNGRRVASDQELGTPYGGNEIDLPALHWLAEQPWPRVWISDGQVVSPSHGYTPMVVKECMDFCKEAGIKLVPDAQTAGLYIKGDMKAQLPTTTRWKRTMKPKRGALKA